MIASAENMMETDKYSPNKDTFDQLSDILSKNGDQVLFHSLKFFTQDCLDFEAGCNDIPTIFELINKASEGKFSDHDKFAHIHKMLQIINNRMNQDYIREAMELISPAPMEAPMDTTSEEELSLLSLAPPKEYHPPPPPASAQPHKFRASSPSLADTYIFEIASKIQQSNLEIFSVTGLGMTFTDYENTIADRKKQNERAREVMKWWRQKAPFVGQMIEKTPPYTKSGLKQALLKAGLKGVCRELGLGPM